jgi:hypothetical protein
LLQSLRDELEGLGPMHTSARDVAFEAYFAVKSGVVPAAAAAPKARPVESFRLDMEAVRQACGVEIGMFCNGEKAKPASLARCLRGHSHDLLQACSQSLSILGQ